MTDEKLIEDLKILARWEPTSKRRVEICEAAADRLQEFRDGEICLNCEHPRKDHCAMAGGTQDGECNFFEEGAGG